MGARSRHTRRRGRRGASAQRRGVALIMVMVITTVLAAIAADLENETQVNIRAAANARDELQAHFHARSALELELFVLRFQSMIKGVLGNFIPVPLFELSGVLVSSDTMKGLLSEDGPHHEDEAKKGSYALNQPFGDFQGSFWIEEVVDENRKINLNSEGFGVGCQNFMHLLMAAVFDDPKYDVLFENLGDSRDPIRNRLEVIANITDWVDGNDTVDPVCIITQDTSGSGPSEDTRYNHLPYNANYKPKNGMLDSLAELRLVPGVNDAFMRLFARYFTVWSDTAGISMQTADPWMIQAVIRAIQVGPPQPGDAEKFQKFEQERALMMAMPPPLNKLSMPVFKQLLQSAQIPYDDAKLTQLDQKKFIRFDDISSVYRITAVGRVNDASSKITIVWRDNRAQGEIYYWREE
ncbi:MAG: general secretion pathway protein GspK [Myxococcales bacterium]|nr:general secretion pathway protein GspK [Myxococcales bacterium]